MSPFDPVAWVGACGTTPKSRFTLALDRYQSDFARDAAAATKFVAHGKSPRDTSLDAKEHAAYAALASLILNLDEAVTKE